MTSAYVLNKDFGLSEADVERMLVHQHRRCAGCGKLFSPSRPYAVDHAHLTGLVRGLMCQVCNHEVGFRGDNLAWFKAIATYLEDPPAKRVLGCHYVPGSAGAELGWSNNGC